MSNPTQEVFVMATPSSCPAASRLQQLIEGTMSAAEQADLITHLDHCEACRRMLDRLAGVSPALLDAAAALHTTTIEMEAPRRRVLNALGSDPGLLTQARAHGWTSWWPSLLRPAESLAPLSQ